MAPPPQKKVLNIPLHKKKPLYLPLIVLFSLPGNAQINAEFWKDLQAAVAEVEMERRLVKDRLSDDMARQKHLPNQ